MFYLYKITNLINNKIYIGVRKSSDINNDPYMGSGLAIQRAIDKYGVNSFERTILDSFDTMDAAYQAIIQETFHWLDFQIKQLSNLLIRQKNLVY